MSTSLTDVQCPHCGEPPLEESVHQAQAAARLKELDYLHEDYDIECPNGHTWTHGVPIGDPENADDWTCAACGGYHVIRDVMYREEDNEVQVWQKCQDCKYKPAQPLRFEPDPNRGNNTWAIFTAHPAICGNTDEATPYQT